MNLYKRVALGNQAEADKEYIDVAVESARQNILAELEQTPAHEVDVVKGLHARLILLMEVRNGINKIINDGKIAAHDVNSPSQ